MDQKKSILKRGMKLLKPHWKKLMVGVFLSILATACGILSGYTLKIVVDDVLMKGNLKWLWPLEIGFIVVVLLESLFEILQSRKNAKVAGEVLHDLKKHVYHHLLRLDYRERNTLDQSGVLNLLTYNLDSLHGLLMRGIPSIFSSVITIVAVVGFMFYVDWRLTLLSFVIYPLLIWVNKYIRKKMHALEQNRQEKRRQVIQQIGETHRCLDHIWVYNLFSKMEDRFQQKVHGYQNSSIAIDVFQSISYKAGWALIMVPYQAILYGIGGTWLIRYGYPTLGVLLIFGNFTNYLIQPVMELVNLGQSIGMAKVGFDQMDTFLALAEQMESPTEDGEDTISLQGMSFGYDDRPILKDLHFDFPREKTTVLWGESGKGKSTLLKLMYGFLHSDGGLMIREKKKSAEDWLRGRAWAYFPQSPHLFDGTLRENFLLVNPRLKEEDMWRYLRLVNMEDAFSKEGLDMDISQGESRFSGGEYRRLALAVFFGYEANILLLDEPTASLDERNRRLIFEAIQNIRTYENKTILIATHDQDIRDRADVVYEIQ
ncbi:MAG: ABC transporter ATP-binding protein [Tissierellia bacterium]|nr:ABC transporter ATP-binding protein [Tissierellia bacterium]